MIDNTIGRRNAALVLGVIGAAILIGAGPRKRPIRTSP